MISSNEIRNRQISAAQGGYNKDEVNALLDEAADTVDAYAAESKELYHKLEVLASKIEDYRKEEDSIKTAIISAQKMASSIEKESKEKSTAIVDEATKKAEEILSAANTRAKEKLEEADVKVRELLVGIEQRDNSSKANAEKLITETRAYCKNLIAENNEKATAVINDAETKANEAINSSKIVAQNILDQAKEISDELLSKSREEKEAYELLVSALKDDAKDFIENLKSLYSSQLEVLNNAKLESDNAQADKPTEDVVSIHEDVESLVTEMSEIGDSIPESITIEKTETQEEIVETEDAPVIDDYEDVFTNQQSDEAEEIKAENSFELKIEEEIAPEENVENDEEEETTDPMQAVAAFSQNEITPIDTTSAIVPEINEEPEMQEAEKSLFDDEEQLPFESYFNVKREDAHLDRTQTISLIPPEEEDDDEPKFKGFFKKKK